MSTRAALTERIKEKMAEQDKIAAANREAGRPIYCGQFRRLEADIKDLEHRRWRIERRMGVA